MLERIRPQHRILDLGAGAGVVPEMDLRGHDRRVVGIDPELRVGRNPLLDGAAVGRGDELPFRDGCFDLVVADNVLEHLKAPERVFREVARVLAPGGAFLAKTPNRHHYVTVAARLTPHPFHRSFNRRRGRPCEDTYPTYYRANTIGQLRRHAVAADLVVERIERIEGRPEYLRPWPLLYLLGWLYERSVHLVPGAAAFRLLLVAVFSKPDPSGGR